MPYFKAKKRIGKTSAKKRIGKTSAKIIYGAKWYGTADSSWERTDDAASFADPNPAVANGTGSSPFDNIMPWAGMTIVEDAEAGTLVKIPKFYYRWIRDGVTMQLQISMEKYSGFSCSPAHMDRGDGQGERDVVYIGRYHCADSTYKSTTGVKPQVNITRSTARTNIHRLGSEIWQNDFAMFWTVRMLYLVEFANWNSQAKIGYGCSPDKSIFNMGYTDNMQYHTGTDANTRTTYGGTQYRNIEGLWDNCFDWCDGLYFSGVDIYSILNPSDFSDDTNGTKIGTRPTSSGYISVWNMSLVSDYDWLLYPLSVSGGSQNNYICDYCDYDKDGNVLYVGGDYYNYMFRGMFYISGHKSGTYVGYGNGTRLMKLPDVA